MRGCVSQKGFDVDGSLRRSIGAITPMPMLMQNYVTNPAFDPLFKHPELKYRAVQIESLVVYQTRKVHYGLPVFFHLTVNFYALGLANTVIVHSSRSAMSTSIFFLALSIGTRNYVVYSCLCFNLSLGFIRVIAIRHKRNTIE